LPAKATEVLYEIAYLPIFLAVYTSYKAGIVVAGQAALEAACEAERPGNAHPTADPAGRRHLYSAQQFDQSGFPGAIPAKQSDLLAGRDLQINPLQDLFAAASHRI
jgi:hypothetical protein